MQGTLKIGRVYLWKQAQDQGVVKVYLINVNHKSFGNNVFNTKLIILINNYIKYVYNISKNK